jgi:beta-galactosidase
MGTYQADFYAGTAAVTRNAFGSGHGWYVGAGLDQAGVSWVIRQVLERHELLGPYPGQPHLETAVRVAPDGQRMLFVLNHGADAVDVQAPGAGTDMLTGRPVECGQQLRLRPAGVHVQTVSS